MTAQNKIEIVMPTDFYSKWNGDILEILRDDSVLFGQSVDAVVRLSHTTNLTANGVSLEGTCHSPGGFVNINDVHLNRSVIFGSDDSVASRAEIVIEFQNCPFLKNIDGENCLTTFSGCTYPRTLRLRSAWLPIESH
mgnify:CR=1 FL=1